MKGKLFLSAATAALLAAGPVFADSPTPTSFMGSVSVGGSISITDKVGVITAGLPTTAQADVLFVTDTTGSMGPAIGALQSELSSVISSISGLGNIATGAAQYKDRTSDGYDPFDYNLDQDITTNASLTQNAINGYTASGGGDNPEQGLNALSQGATTTSWRAGSKKIEVITGDAPSHSSPSHPPAANGVGVSSVASTLTSNGVTMIALNVGSAADGTPGLGGDTSNGLNAYGQFSGAGSLLANGVSGTYEDAIPDATTLANDIIAAIGSSFSTYSTVSLALVGPAPTDCSVSLPSSFSGSFDRSVTRTFGFGDVSIKGTHAGVCSFTIGLEADGALLATESDTITVGSAVPEPAALAVLGAGLIGLGAVRRTRAR